MKPGSLRAATESSGTVVSEHAAASSIDMRGASFDGSFVPLTRPRVHPTTPWYRNREYFLGQWFEPSIWRSAVIESVAMAALVYISGQIAGTLQSYGTNQLGGYIGISNIFLLSVMIYATAPATGGHMNPVITFSAILTGLCPVARGVLYLCGQTLGAGLAAGVLRGVWGHARSIQYHGGGCFWDASEASSSQIFLNEVFATFCLLYLSFGVGLDPRQALLFGPRFGPLLVGVSLGLISFATSGIIPGYAGAQMNPARCFAYGIVRGNLSDQWIWWFGPAAAGLLLAMLYNLIPPHHSEEKQKSSQASTSVA